MIFLKPSNARSLKISSGPGAFILRCCRAVMLIGAVHLSLGLATVLAQPAGYTESPFWQASEGWWRSTNTYFDGDLNYNIREYHSLIHITVDGETLVETEYRFYPFGDLAEFYADGELRDGEGIELVSTTRWSVLNESTAQLTSNVPAFGPLPTMHTRILADDVAVRRVVDPKSGIERYRMLITLHEPERRNIAHYGLNPEAESGLSGVAVFRGQKLSADSVVQERESLRRLHRVAVSVVANGAGEPVVSRLTAPENR